MGIATSILLLVVISIVSLYAGVEWTLLLLLGIIFVFPVIILLAIWLVITFIVAGVLKYVKSNALGRKASPDTTLGTQQLTQSQATRLHCIFLIASFIIGMIPGILIYLALIMPVLNRVQNLSSSKNF